MSLYKLPSPAVVHSQVIRNPKSHHISETFLVRDCQFYLHLARQTQIISVGARPALLVNFAASEFQHPSQYVCRLWPIPYVNFATPEFNIFPNVFADSASQHQADALAEGEPLVPGRTGIHVRTWYHTWYTCDMKDDYDPDSDDIKGNLRNKNIGKTVWKRSKIEEKKWRW